MQTKTERTMTPKQIARRNSILQTVRNQLAENGYDALSMRKIAATAGVSPSTLYEIYGDKESLITHSIGNYIDALSIEEEQYNAGLDRFLHRLDSLGRVFMDSPQTGEAITKLLFEGSKDSIAKEFLLTNAIKARRLSLEEMREEKEIVKTADLDFLARTLISLTWGTFLFWLKGTITAEEVRDELIRASLTVLLPISTKQSRAAIQSTLKELSS